MKNWNILAFLALMAMITTLSWALPQGYGPGSAPQVQRPAHNGNIGRNPTKTLPHGCRIEYRNFHQIVQKEEFETKCVDTYRTHCENQPQRLCEKYEEPECSTIYKKKCDTLYRDNCYEAYKDAQEEYSEEYSEEECKDKYVKVCEKHWESAGDNEKIWADDPETCKDLKKTECYPVQKFRTKYRTVKQPYRKCDQEPYTDCKEVPSRLCKPVIKERCITVNKQVCREVPHKDCKEVHKLVPHQVVQRRPYKVCTGQGEDPFELTDQDLIEYDFIDPRAGEPDAEYIDFDTENDEESPRVGISDENEQVDVEEAKKKPSSTAIVFGR